MKESKQIFTAELEVFLKKKKVYRRIFELTKEKNKHFENKFNSLIELFVFADTKEGHNYWWKLQEEFNG